MTIEQRISDWMKDREDELVEALRPLIEAESTLGEARPGMPFGEGPALALDRGLELAKKWGFAVENQEGYVGTADLMEAPDGLHILVKNLYFCLQNDNSSVRISSVANL